MKMSSLSKLFNAFLYVVIALMLFQRIPVFVDMFKRQGQPSIPTSVQTLKDERLTLPLPGKHLMVFWATWCGPCKVELSRINNMIKNGTLDGSKVIAISSSEEPTTVRSFVQEKDYRFLVGVDTAGTLAKQYKVSGTPTLILIDETGKIDWMTMGLSPSLEIRLKTFLQN